MAIEISMSTPNALDALRQARAAIGQRACLGVGTVLDAATCHARSRGGRGVRRHAHLPHRIGRHRPRRGPPDHPGCLHAHRGPTAHEAGADFIKIFPADGLGPGYMKALRAPLPHLRLVPTGGVNVQNVADFFKAGCAAVGIGSLLVSAKILQDSDWPELTRRAQEFVTAARPGTSLKPCQVGPPEA